MSRMIGDLAEAVNPNSPPDRKFVADVFQQFPRLSGSIDGGRMGAPQSAPAAASAGNRRILRMALAAGEWAAW